MISHIPYTAVGIPVLVLFAIAIIGYTPVARRWRFPLGPVALILGWLLMTLYLVWQWVHVGHPPMRSIHQTMLWVIFFLPLISLGMEWRTKARSQIIPSILLAGVFVIGTLVMNEAPAKELMPALQSPWFAPHVLIYMLAYATFAVAAVIGIWSLCFGNEESKQGAAGDIRRLVYIGYPLLTAGMLMGAFWAKIAWGHYWSWDPKETLAFASWAVYLAYIHLDYRIKLSPRAHMALAIVAAFVVFLCWFGINVLPAASVHKYAG